MSMMNQVQVANFFFYTSILSLISCFKFCDRLPDDLASPLLGVALLPYSQKLSGHSADETDSRKVGLEDFLFLRSRQGRF